MAGLVAVVVALISAMAAVGAAGAELTATGAMLGEHQEPVAAALPGGKVLVVSGNRWRDPREMEPYPTTEAEIYDPATGSFTETGEVLKGRVAAATASLPGGRVLVVGGRYANEYGTELGSAEIYDPSTGTFSSTGSLAAPRRDLFAVTLADGSVLVGAGVTSVAYGQEEAALSTEIYDPATGAFTPGPTLPTARFQPGAALLPDGKVLIAGGLSGESQGPSSEIFDPCTGESTPGPEMVASGASKAATLTDGRVLISTQTGDGSVLEEYDAVAEAFVATGIASNSIRGAAVAPLAGGRALVAGRVGFASENTAARQAFVFSGVEAPDVGPAPVCGESEPTPPEGSPLESPPSSTPPSDPGSSTASPVAGASPPAPAAAHGVSAARAESKRRRRRHRRHHKRHHRPAASPGHPRTASREPTPGCVTTWPPPVAAN